MTDIKIYNKEALQHLLDDVPSDSVDLILTDPPYVTSRDSGMQKWLEKRKAGKFTAKTEEEWRAFKTMSEWKDFLRGEKKQAKSIKKRLQRYKENYLKCGSIYGDKYAIATDYGSWDSEFTLETLDAVLQQFYRVLRPGGTCIIFFDLWKITNLKDLMENCGPIRTRKDKETGEMIKETSGFKQLRFIEWVKTNPVPINSKRNYLTNSREIALGAVKKGSCTFNSQYDNAIYRYPIYAGKDRFHPTQKSLPLFEELIRKHSNEGDLVLDTFLGSGTTAVAALNTNRKFIGCELSEEYYNKSLERVKEYEISMRQSLEAELAIIQKRLEKLKT
jgi:site-specific DNA-methyltransferase (adenine-specific)